MSDVVLTILADSSLIVANHWPTVITVYINSLLLRLYEGRTSDQFYISIVTYSTADHRPTPVIAKRYFNESKYITKELKDDPTKLGIGTGSGGKAGMAALEGYAATLEMFDLFLSTYRASKETISDKPTAENQTGPLCHIIHVSGCATDESRHPLWNQTSALDGLSWKTLPDELRKRNINLNIFLLSPNKHLSDFHSTITSESQSIPCKVHADHTLLLAPPASWAVLSAKRANGDNNETANTDDAKRARVSTPKHTPAAAAPQVVQPAKPAENRTAPPIAQPNPAQPSLPNPSLPSLSLALKKYKEMEAHCRQSQLQAEQLRQQGRLQEYEALKNANVMKNQQVYKLKSYIMALQQRAMAAAKSAGPSNQAEGSGGQATQPAPGPTGGASLPNPQVPSAQALQQLVQSQRQSQQLIPGIAPFQNPSLPPQISPSVAVQMQKLQMKEGIQGQVSMSSTPAQQPQQPQQQSLMNQSAQHVSNSLQNQQKPPTIWNGTIAWKAPPSMNQMESHVQVRSTALIRPELWPPRLEIEFTREQAVPLQTLKPWINLHKPAVCQLRPIPIPNNPYDNELRFKSLSILLVERNVNVVASWPVNNIVKPRLLLFPMGGDGTQLAAAVFPETGIPELPRVIPAAPPQPAPRPQLQPFAGIQSQAQLAAIMQTMNPEQRAAVLSYLRQQQLQRPQQQQQQQQQPIQQPPQAQQNANPPNTNPIVNNNLNTGNPFMLANLPGGGWPGGMGQNVPAGMQMNFPQALAAMQQQQQQRQNGMSAPPGSGGPPPF